MKRSFGAVMPPAGKLPVPPLSRASHGLRDAPSEPGGKERAALAGWGSPCPVGRGARAALCMAPPCSPQETLWASGLPVAAVMAPVTPGPAFTNIKVLEVCTTHVRPGKGEKEAILIFGACYFQVLYYRELG